MNWGELLSAFTLVTAVFSAIGWLISKATVTPAIDRQTEKLTARMEEFKTWAKQEFPASAEFEAHTKSDDLHARSMEREIQRLWDRLDHK